MWICPNCEEPNSCNGNECPYCKYKGKNFRQEIFIIKSRWIKDKAKLIDRVIKGIKRDKRIKKERWIDKIPEEYWNNLRDLEKDFLFKIQEELTHSETK